MTLHHPLATVVRTSALAALTAGLLTTGGTAHADTDTNGAGSIGGGNQVLLPINLPITIGGNAISVLGDAKARSTSHTTIETATEPRAKTTGQKSILGGNQIIAPITAPITACGNAVSVLGSATARCRSQVTIRSTPSGQHAETTTSGKDSILGGNQVIAPINAPVTACGNAIGLLGSADAGCKSTVDINPGSGPHGHKSSPGHRHSGPHHGYGWDDSGWGSHPADHGHPVAWPRHARHLPFTGAPIELLAGLALAGLTTGGALMFLGRRRRTAVAGHGTALAEGGEAIR